MLASTWMHVIIIVTSFCINLAQVAQADNIDNFKKNIIKQRSNISDNYIYHEQKNGRVLPGSKPLGSDISGNRSGGTVHSWVEINNSSIPSTPHSVVPPNIRNHNSDDSSAVNVGIRTDCKSNKDIDNTVIVRDANIVSVSGNAGVNFGVVSNCSKYSSMRNINNTTIDNHVVLEGVKD